MLYDHEPLAEAEDYTGMRRFNVAMQLNHAAPL
jgi:hypothetical protein